jgi:hypothetical protein
MLTRNRTRTRWVAAFASTLDVWNVVLIAYDLTGVGEVVPLVSTQILLHRLTFLGFVIRFLFKACPRFRWVS